MITKIKKCLFGTLRAFFLLFFVVFLAFGISAGHVLWHYPSTADTKRTCGVIFGAAVWRGDIPSHALADRTLSAAELYSDQRVSCLVLSGGASTYGAHEVDVMKKVLLEEGIPSDVLVYDYNGSSTIKTLENLGRLDPGNSYVLVSNDFHLGRIKLLAHQAGLSHFDVHASEYHFGRYPKEPYYFVREVIANIYYFFRLEKINAPKKIPSL
jgi:vancomycin permeability regulator SanA